MNRWGWLAVVALVAVIVFSVRAWAGAIGEANVHRELAEARRDTLEAVALDTVRLSEQYRGLEEMAREQALIREREIERLRASNASLVARIERLAAEERAQAEALDAALGALADALDPDDLPLLRSVRAAQERLVQGLREQIQARDERLALQNEEITLVRATLMDERRVRRAAEAMVEGLRAVIVEHERLDAEQVAEIAALRRAVAPGLVQRIVQNASLVAGTVAVTATVVLLVR